MMSPRKYHIRQIYRNFFNQMLLYMLKVKSFLENKPYYVESRSFFVESKITRMHL